MSTFLSCSVCSSPFSDPRLLPCLHVFCKSCLDDPLYSQNEEGTLACPTCYKINTCPSPSQLPRHLGIEREVTKSKLQDKDRNCQSCFNNGKAEAYCKDCAFLICSDCKESHKVLKVFKYHSIVELNHGQPPPVSSSGVQRVPCILHPDEYVKYYCNSCSCLVCSECLFSHNQHNCDRITNDELVKREKDQLLAVLPHVDEAIPCVTQAIDMITDNIKRTEANKDRTIEEINNTFKQMSEAIENRRSRLIEDVSEVAVAKSTRLEIQMEGLEKLLGGLKLASKAGNVAANEYSDIEVLAVKGSIVKASKELVQEHESTNYRPVCGSGLGAVIDTSEVLELIPGLGSVSMRIVSPTACSLVNCTQTIAVGMNCECSVTLQTRNSNGDDLTVGGAIVTGTLTNSSDESQVHECGVKDMENGQYEIILYVPVEGQFLLHVSVGNTTISDSPLTVNVRDYTTITNQPQTTIPTPKPAMYIDMHPKGLMFVTFVDGSVGIINRNDGGIIKTISRSRLGCSENLRGIAVGDNVMFVVDSDNHQIIQASLSGKVINRVGCEGSGELEFDRPTGLCLTKDGILLIADSRNERIQVLGYDLSFFCSIPCLTYVAGVAVDGSGNIHVTGNGRLEVFSITGLKIKEYGQGVIKDIVSDVAFLQGSRNPYSFVSEFSNNTPNHVHVFNWYTNTLLNTIVCGSPVLGMTLSHDGLIVVCYFSDKNVIMH